MWIMVALIILGVLCLGVALYAKYLQARRMRTVTGSLLTQDDAMPVIDERPATLADFRNAENLKFRTKREYFADGLIEIYLGILMLPFSVSYLITPYLDKRYEIPIHLGFASLIIIAALLFAYLKFIGNIRRPGIRPGAWVAVAFIGYGLGIFLGDLAGLSYSLIIIIGILGMLMFMSTRYTRSFFYIGWAVVSYLIAAFIQVNIFADVKSPTTWIYLASVALFSLAPLSVGIFTAAGFYRGQRSDMDFRTSPHIQGKE